MSDISDERLAHLLDQLDTAPYPNNCSRDICDMLRELQRRRADEKLERTCKVPV
jgi:hypothetical protein